MEELQRFGKAQIEQHRLRDNFYAIDLGRLHRLYTVRPCRVLNRETLCCDVF